MHETGTLSLGPQAAITRRKTESGTRKSSVVPPASRTVGGVRPAAPYSAHIDELGGQRGGRSILAHVDERPLAHAALLGLLVVGVCSTEQKNPIYRRTAWSSKRCASLLAGPSRLRFLLPPSARFGWLSSSSSSSSRRLRSKFYLSLFEDTHTRRCCAIGVPHRSPSSHPRRE
uniref:Uncharacterized protein n=1 Tax=Plectus sambesii TaxID=2011161 RepID=A0A914WL18_9BILA